MLMTNDDTKTTAPDSGLRIKTEVKAPTGAAQPRRRRARTSCAAT